VWETVENKIDKAIVVEAEGERIEERKNIKRKKERV